MWGPLVAGRPQAMRLVGWLAWAAIALLALGAVVRVGEAVWGVGCTAYVLVRSLAEAVSSSASAIERGARSSEGASALRSATQQKWVKNGNREGSGT